jgi:hypothetical protein
MKGSWKKVAAFALVVAITFGMGLPKLQAGLQAGPIHGKFKMPFDADLGKITIPTGDYTFSVSHLALDSTIYIYQGTKAVAMLRAQSFTPNENKGENPVFIFVRHDGNTTLRALRLPQAGTFYFPLPKKLQNLVAQQPQLIETISVQVSGD